MAEKVSLYAEEGEVQGQRKPDGLEEYGAPVSKCVK